MARTLTAAAALLGAAIVGGCSPRQPWRGELVTRNLAGDNGITGLAGAPVFSADGARVAFSAHGGPLVSISTVALTDVYVRDLAAGTTDLVSVSADGQSGGDGRSWGAAISPDGTKVAFTTEAGNLGPADSNQGDDVYLRDLTTGQTRLVSARADGLDAGSRLSGHPVFSPDSTTVAYQSRAGDLGATDGNATVDVYLYDIAAGTNALVSVNGAGSSSGNGLSMEPAFSPDGTSLAFTSTADDLGPGDANAETADVFVRDLASGQTTLVSVNADQTAGGDLSSYSPLWAPHGAGLAFLSDAGDLDAPADVNGAGEHDVYYRDLMAGTTTLVSVAGNGTETGNGLSDTISFSPDGRQIAFVSDADNLGPTDHAREVRSESPHLTDHDVYVRDLTSQSTTLVSVRDDERDSGNGSAYRPRFSPDRDVVVFESIADDLGPTDSSKGGRGQADIYARDLATDTTTLVSTRHDGRDGADQAARFPIPVPGGQVAFVSSAGDVGPQPVSGGDNIWIARLRNADLGAELSSRSEPVLAGGRLIYDLAVTSDGPETADGSIAALLLPEGTTFLEAGPSGGRCQPPSADQPRLVVCQLGDLDGGTRLDVQVTANVTAPAGTRLEAVAVVDSDTLDADNADNLDRVTSSVI